MYYFSFLLFVKSFANFSKVFILKLKLLTKSSDVLFLGCVLRFMKSKTPDCVQTANNKQSKVASLEMIKFCPRGPIFAHFSNSSFLELVKVGLY